MAEQIDTKNIDRNRDIIKAVEAMFAAAVAQLPTEIEPALIYSLSPSVEEPDESAESR
jgi:hypothetical protein